MRPSCEAAARAASKSRAEAHDNIADTDASQLGEDGRRKKEGERRKEKEGRRKRWTR
jgi:hypothetical protein